MQITKQLERVLSGDVDESQEHFFHSRVLAPYQSDRHHTSTPRGIIENEYLQANFEFQSHSQNLFSHDIVDPKIITLAIKKEICCSGKGMWNFMLGLHRERDHYNQLRERLERVKVENPDIREISLRSPGMSFAELKKYLAIDDFFNKYSDGTCFVYAGGPFKKEDIERFLENPPRPSNPSCSEDVTIGIANFVRQVPFRNLVVVSTDNCSNPSSYETVWKRVGRQGEMEKK